MAEARALGHGMKVGIVQFIKGAFSTGEQAFFSKLPNVDYHDGPRYTWDTQDREQDVTSANAAWDIVAGMLQNDSYDLILLDELNIALKYEYIDLTAYWILASLSRNAARRVTGRNAPQELIDTPTLSPTCALLNTRSKISIKAQKVLNCK